MIILEGLAAFMKKKLNVIFFGICLMASILLEGYCFIVLDGEPVSTIGIGIIVLIMSYLLLDSIREQIILGSRNARVILEQIYYEDSEKWNERCMEVINLQKATYTATKKNTVMLEDKLDRIITAQEQLNQETLSTLQYIANLQEKFLEGQKNALNIEVNYNNKNTKLLLETFQEEIRRLDNKDQLAVLINLFEQKQVEGLKTRDKRTEDTIETEEMNDFEDAIETKEMIEAEKTKDSEEFIKTGDPIVTEDTVETEENVLVEIPKLYEDPNKALTADEIAALFSTYGK